MVEEKVKTQEELKEEQRAKYIRPYTFTEKNCYYGDAIRNIREQSNRVDKAGEDLQKMIKLLKSRKMPDDKINDAVKVEREVLEKEWQALNDIIIKEAISMEFINRDEMNTFRSSRLTYGSTRGLAGFGSNAPQRTEGEHRPIDFYKW